MTKYFTACVVLLFGVVAYCEEAASFRGDVQHSGIYSGPGLSKYNKMKWKFHTRGEVISSPAVANDTVYFGSTDHRLYAVGLNDGALRWKFQTQGRVASSPAVAAGTVFFGSYDGNFYAVDAVTGALRWKFVTAGEKRYAATHLHGSEPVAETMPDPFDFYLSSPAIANGVVYFGSGDNNVYALNADTGTLKWKVKTGDVVHASPAVWNGNVYVGSWDSYFYAIDAATGKIKWRFKTGEDPLIHNQVGIQASAAVVDGVVYFGCRDSHLYAVDALTGQKKWAFSTGASWVINSAAVKGDTVYFSTSDSGRFTALNAKTGVELYTLKFIWPMFSSPAIAGNTLYVGSHAGRLIAIDLSKREAAWTFETDGYHENAAKYTKPDGTPKYEAAFEGDFYDDMVVGVARMMTVGAVLSSPVVAADGTVLFGSMDGNLYALD